MSGILPRIPSSRDTLRSVGLCKDCVIFSNEQLLTLR